MPDEEVYAFVNDLDRPISSYLYGRRMYETMVFWETASTEAEPTRLRALALTESDLDARRGAILVRHGEGDKRREVGMDSWAWDQVESWRADRTSA
jgi:integrase